MTGYQSVREVTCTSAVSKEKPSSSSETKNEEKIYLDAHSIGSNDNSVMNEILLAGVFHKTRPFLEKLTYQIPTSQYELKYLWKLPHDNITKIIKVGNEIIYQADDDFYSYDPNTKQANLLNGLIEPKQYQISKLIQYPKKLSIDLKFNVLIMDGWHNIHYPIKIYFEDDQKKLNRIKPTDKIVNFCYTNNNIQNIRNEPTLIIVFKDSVAMAKLKLIDYDGFDDDFNHGYEVDYESLYPNEESGDKRFKLIIYDKLSTEHLNIIDVAFYRKKTNDEKVSIFPILLSSNGRAYFYNEKLDKINLQVSSINNQLFKVFTLEFFCFLYNDNEMILVDLDAFIPSKVDINICPRDMFGLGCSAFILASNSKIYEFKFTNFDKPITKIDRLKFKLGLPLRILPLIAKDERTLILSQYDFNGTKTDKRKGLALSLLNNQSMEVIKSFEIPNTSGSSYVIMEPLLKSHPLESCYWEDTVMVAYQLPKGNKSYWHIVKIIRGRKIQILLEGEESSTITAIFSEPQAIGNFIKICMPTAKGLNYLLLSTSEEGITLKEKGKIPQPAEVYNIGGFYQNGVMQLINPYDGLYLNQDLDGDVNLIKEAQDTKPQIFSDGDIMKIATKVWEPLDRMEYNILLKSTVEEKENPFREQIKFNRYDERILLSKKYNERKDFQRTFCAMLAADNFIYLYDDVSELLPNNTLNKRPMVKFRPNQRIVNITPISQNYEASSFEKKAGMIPLFYLLGLDGAAYILSVSYDASYTDKDSVTVSIDGSESILENNGAPLWIKPSKYSDVRASLKIVPS